MIQVSLFTDYSGFSSNDVLEFLSNVDGDFIPPLSTRVDLDKYAVKLSERAVLIVAVEDNSIVGLLAVYCNNYSTGAAYIPLVSVKKDFQGHGIGKAILAFAIKYVKEKNFKSIELATELENQISQQLYTRMGFKIINTVTDTEIGVRKVKMILNI